MGVGVTCGGGVQAEKINGMSTRNPGRAGSRDPAWQAFKDRRMASIVQQTRPRASNLIKYSNSAMLILITVTFLFAIALLLVALQVMRPNYRFAWLIAVGGAFLAWISVLLWQARMPLILQLPAWGSESLFANSLFFQAEPINWAYALALTTLGLATILTAVVRPNFPAVLPLGGHPGIDRFWSAGSAG